MKKPKRPKKYRFLKIFFSTIIILLLIGTVAAYVYNYAIWHSAPSVSHKNFVLPSGWQLYKNDQYHFSIAYPQGYKTSVYVPTQTERGAAIKQEEGGAHSTAGDSETIAQVTLWLAILDPNGQNYFDVTLDTKKPADIDHTLKYQYENDAAVHIDTTRFQLNGHDAVKYVTVDSQPASNTHVAYYSSILYTFANNLSYEVTPGGGQKPNDAFTSDPTIKKMYESFNITN